MALLLPAAEAATRTPLLVVGFVVTFFVFARFRSRISYWL